MVSADFSIAFVAAAADEPGVMNADESFIAAADDR
jgi:hypothetical protein